MWDWASNRKKDVTAKDLKVALLGLRREGRKKQLQLRKLGAKRSKLRKNLSDAITPIIRGIGRRSCCMATQASNKSDRAVKVGSPQKDERGHPIIVRFA